jgi:hypothetical protein
MGKRVSEYRILVARATVMAGQSDCDRLLLHFSRSLLFFTVPIVVVAF